MAVEQRATEPISVALPPLLERAREQKRDAIDANRPSPVKPASLRELAAAIGVNQSYLSRILGAKGARAPSRQVLEKIARIFDLPPEYFAEYRAAVVIEAARDEPALLDPSFDVLVSRQKRDRKLTGSSRLLPEVE